MRRSALILGVTGRIGRPLAIRLLEANWTVYGAARMSHPEDPRRLENAGIRPIEFEVQANDPEMLPDVDTVFLEIWDPDQPKHHWDINFYGVGRVVERYRGMAQIIHGSTLNVYGDSPDPATEDTPCRPTGDYGRSRYAQERLIDYFAVQGHEPAIHLRYAHANSVQHGKIRRTAETILAEESLGPNPDSRLQVIGYEDIVRMTHQAVEYATIPPAAVNCCHPRIWTLRELATTIQTRLGRGAVKFDRPAGGARHSAYGRADRMVEWFGEPQIPVDSLIERVVEDLR